MRIIRYKLPQPIPYPRDLYPWNPRPRTHGADHVCEECFSKPDVQAEYAGMDIQKETAIREDGEWISCTLCGLEAREIGA